MYLKYLFLFLITITSNLYAQCQSDVETDLDVPKSIVDSPQTHVCYNSCRYRMISCVHVDIEGPLALCNSRSTGETCGGTNPDPIEPEPQPTELSCSVETCPNPDNLRCPSGYVSGSINGSKVCTKTTTIPPPCDPQIQECLPQENNNQEVINAVNNANNDITNSVNNMGNTLGDALESVKNLLSDISEKIQNIGNGNSNGGGDNPNEWGYVDTSPFATNLPTRELESQELSENLFSYSAQCPPDSVLTLGFATGFTYSFSYQKLCEPLETISYFIMLFAYLYAISIVVRA